METPSSCKFKPGQIIHHRRYHYRGVIYDVDDSCLAPDEWYRSNKTQPDKNQPWYHVLVDGETNMTYVAEENIEPDSSMAPIDHPLVEQFFIRFERGQYFRNHDA